MITQIIMAISFNYNYLVGKNKREIVSDLGQEFNFFPSNIWTYTLGKSRFYEKTKYLVIYFKEEIATNIEIKKLYGKLKL